MRRTIAALMFFCVLVAGCGGGGGGDGRPPALGSLDSKLFVADAGNASIASTVDADPPAVTLAFDRVIDGPDTGLSNNVLSLEIDRARKLMYVANGDSILVFADIGSADGNVAPARTITSTLFGNITALYLDTGNDMLYAADLAVGIWVIHDASIADGLITPDRRLTRSFGGTSFQIRDLFVDTGRNMLYVSRSTSAPSVTKQILVFNNADSVDDSVNPTSANRVITPSPSMPVGAIFVETGSLNRLYMTDSGSGTVRVFNNASTADGSVSVSRTVDWGVAATDIVVDTPGDRLYAIDAGNVFIVSDVSTVNGVVAAKTLPAPGGRVFTALAVNP